MCSRMKGQNGFEAYRLISRGKDIIYPRTRWDMKSNVLALGNTQCANLKPTRELLTEIEAQSKAYYERFKC